jgi:bacterioferritin-associated ferredoxin
MVYRSGSSLSSGLFRTFGGTAYVSVLVQGNRSYGAAELFGAIFTAVSFFKDREYMAVNRCICNSVLFVDALQLARQQGCQSVASLQRYSPLGTSCGLCIPYMQRALMTGEIDLPILNEREASLLLELSGVMPTEEGRR